MPRRAARATYAAPAPAQNIQLRAWTLLTYYTTHLQVHEAALRIQKIELGRRGRRLSVALSHVREHEAPPPPGKDDFPALGGFPVLSR